MFFKIFVALVVSTVSQVSHAVCNVELSKELCAKVEFQTPITRKRSSKFQIDFYDAKKKALIKLDKDPVVKLWMIMKNGHEHGSEKLVMARNKSGYLISEAWFLMLGEWIVRGEYTYKGKVIRKDFFLCVKRKSSESGLGKCY